jgi:SAM-dependent methyltransferase
VNHPHIQRLLPPFLRRSILHFEASIDQALQDFAAALPRDIWVLDAGAGEAVHARVFQKQHYLALDLAVGNPSWNYGQLDVIADLKALPFRSASLDAAINIVTLEHIREPHTALEEIARVLKPGAPLLLVAPHEWEVHQSPHDYFRYTRHGLEYLLTRAGFSSLRIEPVGGYFRLLSRRLWNGLQFFHGPMFLVAGFLIAIPALILPSLDFIDRERDFTLGYICTGRKPG